MVCHLPIIRPSAKSPAKAWNKMQNTSYYGYLKDLWTLWRLLLSFEKKNIYFVVTYDSNMLVHRIDSSPGIFLIQWASHNFLHGQYNASLSPQPNQCATLLDGLTSIVDLENSAVWRKLRSGQIILKIKNENILFKDKNHHYPSMTWHNRISRIRLAEINNRKTPVFRTKFVNTTKCTNQL